MADFTKIKQCLLLKSANLLVVTFGLILLIYCSHIVVIILTSTTHTGIQSSQLVGFRNIM